MNPFHTGFQCLHCGHHFGPDAVRYGCPDCGANLDATYDYEQIARSTDGLAIARKADRSIWHYAPLLPASLPDPWMAVPTPLSRLGWSPLYRAPVVEKAVGVRRVWLKCDQLLPSASFKDRASALVIARAVELGAHTICAASTGNAAAALAALASGTGLRSVIFVPRNTPEGKLAQILIHGARVFAVEGSYSDCVALAAAAAARFGWHNRNTGANPYTREGKKTAGYEIAEQLAAEDGGSAPFRAPDVVVVPVGDGNIISGVHKGFRDLHALGWISRIPRFVAVTATLAPSLYRAWSAGHERPVPAAASTLASGISVDVPEDGVAALRAVRTSGGAFFQATDEEMLDAEGRLARDTGAFVEPSSAAALVGLELALRAGAVSAQDEVVLQLTGHGLKDPRSALRAAGAPIPAATLDDVARAVG